MRPNERERFDKAQGHPYGFSLRWAIGPADIDSIRGIIVRISASTYTGMHFLYELPIIELYKITDELIRYRKAIEKKRR